MANNIVVKNGADNFPVLSGDIYQETDAVVAEIGVGRIVEERGMARLYLIWQANKFLDATTDWVQCDTCGDSFPQDLVKEGDKSFAGQPCLKCGVGEYKQTEKKSFPTLESYLEHISEVTGRSRQTLFNRIRVYDRLIKRDVLAESIFSLNLISAGAGRLLADADDDDDPLNLVNDSWQDTVDTAIATDHKGGALSFIKYEVLGKPRITTEMEGDDTILVVVEENLGAEDHILKQYKLKIVGEWPESLVKNIRRRFSSMT